MNEQFPENKNVRGIIHLFLVVIAVGSIASLSYGSGVSGVVGFFACWVIFLLENISNYLRVIANAAKSPPESV